MKNFKLYFKSIVQRKARWLLTILAFLTLGVGEMWADKDFWSTNAWNFKYYNGGSDTWIGDQNMGATYNLGVQSTLYFKGTWVKTWWNDNWGTNNVTMYYGFGSNTKSVSNDDADSQWDADGKKQCYWEFGANYDMISNAPNSVGQNTMWVNWSIDNWKTSSTCYINFTIPGFTDLSTTEVTFDNTTVGSSSTKSITYTHYGTAPTNVAARYSITGDDAGDFSITALSGTGATIQFAPTSAGTKTATLVINDVHGKETSSITLTGTTQYTVTYDKGTYGTGDTQTAYKVYGTNLTLANSGFFTRTGYRQTAWNTNSAGTGGTSYALNGTYSTDAALTLYPTWTVNNYAITYSPSTPSHCTYTTTPANANYGSTVNLTITPDANYVISNVTAVDASSTPVSVTGTSPNYSFTMPASDVTVTVVTALSAIAVNYGAGANGSLAAKQSDVSIGSSGSTVAGGSTVNFTATPNTGYEVEGWYSSYSAGVFSDKIDAAGTSTTYNAVANSTLNVYVKFKLSTYTITYENMTGATNHASNPANYNYEAAAITLQTPTKEGYTFGGWFTNADLAAGHEAGTPAIPNHTTGNKTFYAKWTGYSYTVRFNANDGSGTMENETGFVYGTDKALTANTFTRAGYTFSGWATSANGEKVYDDGESVSILPASNGATIDLYAVWTERSAVKVYFAEPADWDNVYAYVWKDGGTTNASWPGKQLNASVAGTGSETINCATYYYYKYYTDGGSADTEGEVGNSTWDKVIFNNGDNPGVANNTKTGNLTLTNGNAYGVHTGMQSTSASGYSSSAKWTLRGSFNSWSAATYPFSCADDAHTYSVSVTGLTASTSYQFKIWGPDGVAYKYTGGKDASYDNNYDITSLLDGRDLILNEYSSQNNTFTAATTSYTFTIDVTDPKHPILTVISGEEANYSATLQAGAHGSVTNAGAATLHRYATTTITATPEPGYRFLNWTSTGGGTVEFGDPSSATTTVTATEDGAVITANFTNDGFIYFDRTAVNGVWAGSDVYFTLFQNDYNWPRHNGYDKAIIIQNYVNNAVYNKRMNRIPNTNIYYYDITGYTEDGSGNKYSKILFTDKSQPAAGNALNAMGAAPCYGTLSLTNDNMYVVENFVKESHNRVGEYVGYWMKYNETGSGIRLHVYNTAGTVEVSGSPKEFTTANAGDRQFTASINLSASTNYKFKVEGFNGTWYGNSGTMTSSNSTAWDFVERDLNNCNFNTTGSGSYKFTLVCTDAGKLKVSLEFPLDVNDYRIVYNGKVKTTGDATHHPSNFIRSTANSGIGKDTVSFFVTDDGEGAPDWSLTLQKCTDASANPVQWANACDAGHTVTAADLGLSGKTGVYVFEIEQNSGGSCNGVAIRNLGEYTGNYYIRTDAAGGGWEAYETTPDNKMEYSSYSKEHSGYDYYYCHWTPTGKNIHFTIANDYSPCITDTFTSGVTPFDFENMPYEASVRFMYNSETNVIGRVYLNGSNDGTTEYLSLRAMNDSIRIDASTPIDKIGSENHLKLQDMGNWIYQKDIQVQEGTHYRLISNYRFNGEDHLQYFKGKDGIWNESTTELLLGGKSASYQTLRLVYDFKTNHLMAAWLVPESGNSPALVLKTNVMILQQNQDTARQITFAETSHALTEIDTVYSTINLTKNFMQNIGQTNSEAARQFFYVSFPYDVDLSDVFGSVGEYGVDWAIQWYDGKKRAREGFWADSEPNWKFFETAKGSTLRAYEGYVLTLNLSKFLDDSKWKYGVTDIYLYFPSRDKIGTIHNESSKTVRVMPEDENTTDYTCTINRATPDGNRTIKDSHWHCIGSPSFARNNKTTWNTHDGTPENWKADKLPFLYEWNSATNTLAPVTTSGNYTFKPLAAYLVQYEGPTITWTNVITVANPIVARRAPETPDKEMTFKLSLMRGEEKMDQTFVRISDNETVTSGFEFGQDLCKEFQRGANIYTIVENTEVAGNSLPLETEKTTTVPVGVRIATADEYTFAMPEGTNGTGVVLVDTENGTRTNLALGDYTVTLGAGTTDGRFVLEISPVANTPTGIGNVQGDNVQCTKAQKRMIDGILYIVKDGKAYDARGTRVE